MGVDHADRSADRLSLEECLKVVRKMPGNWYENSGIYSSHTEKGGKELEVTVGKFFINVNYDHTHLEVYEGQGFPEIRELYKEIARKCRKQMDEFSKSQRFKGLKAVRRFIK